MQVVTGRTFHHSSIILEGIHFLNCKFIECQLIYAGEEKPYFQGCIFEKCEWTFDGPAESTLLLLADLYDGLGEEGRTLVESIFESIRTGSVRLPGTIPIIAKSKQGAEAVAAGS